MRGAGGNIVQFLYGEDGMDATCIEEQYLDFLRMKDRDFKVPLPHICTPANPHACCLF